MEYNSLQIVNHFGFEEQALQRSKEQESQLMYESVMALWQVKQYLIFSGFFLDMRAWPWGHCLVFWSKGFSFGEQPPILFNFGCHD
jgi:hypothetical protein